MRPDRSDDRKLAETLRDRDLVGATAAENGTPISVFEDGKVVWVRVDEEADG